MNTFRAAFCLSLLAPVLHARQDTSADTVGQLSRSAEEQLAGSIQQLNALREQINLEKTPLAQQLSSVEEQLSQLRALHDQLARQVDAGNLKNSNLRTEIKVRQDQMSYIGNLMDEYARNFETKLAVGEAQQYGSAVGSAKEATENTALTMSERFDRQVDFVNVSLQRLSDAVGGMRFPGKGVTLDGTVVDGQYAVVGPVTLFQAGAGANSAAGLAVLQTGSPNPLIRPLEGSLQTGIASLVGSGQGLLPLDPSRGGALRALVQRTNLIDIFEKGGPIMWPLLAASILALGTVLERLIFLMFERARRNPKALASFFAAVERGDYAEAIRIGEDSKYYVVRALGYALAHKEESLPSAVLYATAREMKRYRRGIPILDTVITLAPLLGLLGTITGMMRSFSLIGGELSAPASITGGIAEALIATAFGLGIAITALLPFNFLNTRMEEARHEIESAATQLELMVQAAEGAPAAEADQHEDLLERQRQSLQRQIDELEARLNLPEPNRRKSAAQEPAAKE